MSTAKTTKLRRKLAKIASDQLKMDLQLDSIFRDIKKLKKVALKLK